MLLSVLCCVFVLFVAMPLQFVAGDGPARAAVDCGHLVDSHMDHGILCLVINKLIVWSVNQAGA